MNYQKGCVNAMKGSKYDVAYKQEAIRMIKEEGQSVTDVSQKIGVHIKTLYR
jgi:transposase-like protein